MTIAILDTLNAGPADAVSELTQVGLLLIPDTPIVAAVKTTPVVSGDLVVQLDVGEGALFTAENRILIGGQNPNEIDVAQVLSIAVDVLTLKSPVFFDHVLDSEVQVLESLNLGDVEESGVDDSFTAGTPLKHVGTKHGPFVNNPGHHENEIGFQTINASLDTMKHAWGLLDSEGGGAGTADDPFFLDINMERILRSAVTNPHFINGRVPALFLEGEYVHSGDQFRVEYWSCSLAEGDRSSILVVGDNKMVQFRYVWFANQRAYRLPLV